MSIGCSRDELINKLKVNPKKVTICEVLLNQPAVHPYEDIEMYDDKCDEKLMDELIINSVDTMKFVFGGSDVCIQSCPVRWDDKKKKYKYSCHLISLDVSCSLDDLLHFTYTNEQLFKLNPFDLSVYKGFGKNQKMKCVNTMKDKNPESLLS